MSNIRYQAPPGTLVYWGEAEVRGIKSPTVINLSATDFYDRYAEGDRSPMRTGSYIKSYGIEQKGGPAHDQVKAWREAQGLSGEVEDNELIDWSLRWGNAAPPIEKADGRRHNPIPVKDVRFGHGETKQIDGIYYTNDLSQGSKGRIPFPLPADPAPPVVTPTPTPTVEPEKADALSLVRQLRADINLLFNEAERKAAGK